MDTTTQREQLAQVLATHRTHHTENDGWILTNYVDRPGRDWPETVVLRYRGPAGSAQRAEFPGLSRETVAEALREANYFRTNLGGFDLYGPHTL